MPEEETAPSCSEACEGPVRVNEEGVRRVTNVIRGNLSNLTTGIINFASPRKNGENCPICNEKVGNSQPHVYLEHNDGNRRYKTYSCRVHSGKCYKLHLMSEQALMVIRKHLWEEYQIVANEDEIYEIKHKLELAKHLKEGKTIEWQWEMKYIAQIYDTSPDGAKSFVENDLSNQVNYVDMTWTPVWQLVE